ncbi:hypothetical protein CLAFUW4_20097 [Fulvia fulva]|uniref:uncharacterized protein n=1 Tax=Passalora fulva TaxID=5499 RepID=UPI0028527C1C|nr:uncharacterized protein CLAFUR5_20097 [Fulvia fulva]KAK4612010.1 hypothetical protein CLAFUR4_20097 [Fulvia fulva]KAK4612363.1 hypothetical protein CLAFUR0_20097 [Fulvia fulva]WMI39051.1 hypothetical protein CLAFUR5_20097 [Fulvia fulva]WPV21290.1 hypothetical protein CLAFUW4_20097 [Fulvia fulva]WPV35983.1 hypothetical protein CLAFUW7_20097 [Fulvia fulva]
MKFTLFLLSLPIIALGGGLPVGSPCTYDEECQECTPEGYQTGCFFVGPEFKVRQCNTYPCGEPPNIVTCRCSML